MVVRLTSLRFVWQSSRWQRQELILSLEYTFLLFPETSVFALKAFQTIEGTLHTHTHHGE